MALSMVQGLDVVSHAAQVSRQSSDHQGLDAAFHAHIVESCVRPPKPLEDLLGRDVTVCV